MKRTILILLAVLLLPVASNAQFTYATNNGALTITKFTGAGAVIIPSVANGLPVTSIGASSFEDTFNMTSVEIPDSVTNIGNGAFSDCYSMANVIIGSNVLTIADYAFQYCSKLTSVQIPASVTNIGLEVFAGCTILTNLTVTGPGSAYSSQNGVLFNQDATTLVIYPQALAGSYVVPTTVKNFAEYAFYQGTKLTSISNDNNLVNIEPGAFTGCYGLTNVNFPDGVAIIGGAAFAFCTNLTSVAIPASVTNIQVGAFAECYSLTNCTVDSQNLVYSSLVGVVFDKNQTALVIYPAGLVGAYAIPGTVTSLEEGAFSYCAHLWSVTFPDGLTNIGIQAFYGCSSLSNAPFPSGLAVIGSSAFYSCAKLQGLSFGVSLTNLGNNAFAGCSSLTNVTLGNDVLSLGDGAFGYCSGLRSVSIGNSITNLGLSQFVNCYSLTNVTLGTGIVSVGAYTFENCSSLSNLTFLGNAPGIPGFNTFYNIDPAVKVYYLPGATGWGTSYGGAFDAPVNVAAGILPTVLLANAPPPISAGNAGIFTNELGFTITGASNEIVVVQVSSNLMTWTPIKTNTLVGTSLLFSDPNWRSYPQRFYRVMGQ